MDRIERKLDRRFFLTNDLIRGVVDKYRRSDIEDMREIYYSLPWMRMQDILDEVMPDTKKEVIDLYAEIDINKPYEEYVYIDDVEFTAFAQSYDADTFTRVRVFVEEYIRQVSENMMNNMKNNQ